MRWNPVKKTSQWLVFRDSPAGAKQPRGRAPVGRGNPAGPAMCITPFSRTAFFRLRRDDAARGSGGTGGLQSFSAAPKASASLFQAPCARQNLARRFVQRPELINAFRAVFVAPFFRTVLADLLANALSSLMPFGHFVRNRFALQRGCEVPASLRYHGLMLYYV